VPLEEWTTVAEEHAQSSAHSVHETSNLLNEALHLLPVEQKEILILREYQSFSYKEISEILNCSLVNVKILIFRAREQLKVRLQTLLQEGADND
jgi:RNA polymerase sigma-70 factor (ECF subfamily)